MYEKKLTDLLRVTSPDRYVTHCDNVLIVRNENNDKVGTFKFYVRKSHHESGGECFFIHITSNGIKEGLECGTDIKTYVNTNLETIEQSHNIFIDNPSHPFDRTTYITREGDDYLIRRADGEGNTIDGSVRRYMKSEMDGFVSEGCTLLLERILVQKYAAPFLNMKWLDSNLNICPVTYEIYSKEFMEIDDMSIEKKTMKRIVKSDDGLDLTYYTEYLDCGYLISRLNVATSLKMSFDVIPEEIMSMYKKLYTFERKPLDWEKDLQLHSIFTDLKETYKDKYMSFISKHPELKSMLSDYFQFLLVCKPSDVGEFSKQYFSKYIVDEQ